VLAQTRGDNGRVGGNIGEGVGRDKSEAALFAHHELRGYTSTFPLRGDKRHRAFRDWIQHIFRTVLQCQFQLHKEKLYLTKQTNTIISNAHEDKSLSQDISSITSQALDNQRERLEEAKARATGGMVQRIISSWTSQGRTLPQPKDVPVLRDFGNRGRCAANIVQHLIMLENDIPSEPRHRIRFELTEEEKKAWEPKPETEPRHRLRFTLTEKEQGELAVLYQGRHRVQHLFGNTIG
jgi:hypothetical protein